MTANRYAWALAAIVIIGCIRVVATYAVFSEVLDEPAHIAAGMEWLDAGTYTTDPSHPPLARVSAALLPHLAGIRFVRTGHFVSEGNAVFYANGAYVRNLSLTRLGILPFFVLAVLIVAAWSRALWGDWPALAAAALFANEPTVLAHAGLTTTDMAAAALTITAGYVFWRWLDVLPVNDRRRLMGMSVVFGFTLGLALLSKFSTLLYVPVALAVVLICRIVARRDGQPVHRLTFPLLIVLLTASLTTWAGYRFSLGTLDSLGGRDTFDANVPLSLRKYPWIDAIPQLTLPAPEFVHGALIIRQHEQGGHYSYLLGQTSPTGWWYYFPIAIATKTTLAFLILWAIGIAAAIARAKADRRSIADLAPLAAGVAILIVSLPVKINIGVRHVLPVYPFFAMAAGLGLVALVTRFRRPWIAAVLGLAAATASLASHPDYLPYFNIAAGTRPEKVLLDSNLDWGQDLLRLRRELRRRHVESVALAYAGNAEPERHDFPTIEPLEPHHYTPGWIAVSEMAMYLAGDGYAWLDLFKPVTHVGKSIRLYYVPLPEEVMGHVPITLTGSIRGGRARILLPMWFAGRFLGETSWRCELMIRNENPGRLRIYDGPDPSARVIAEVAPRSTVTNPRLQLEEARKGAILYIAPTEALRTHFALKVQSGESGINLPVLREQELRGSTIEFLDVPIRPTAGVTLRIYDLTGEAVSATVRLVDSRGSHERTIPLVREHRGAAYPSSIEAGLNLVFPDARGPSARLIVEPPSGAYWALLGVTDSATKTGYVLFPN